MISGSFMGNNTQQSLFDDLPLSARRRVLGCRCCCGSFIDVHSGGGQYLQSD